MPLVRALQLLLALCLGAAAMAVGCASPGPDAHDQASETDHAIGIEGARRPMDGIITMGQPTHDDLRQALRHGVRTVVSLRVPHEPGFMEGEAAEVVNLGMGFVDIPIRDASSLTEMNVQSLARVIDDPANHPILLHCGSGNRVGALLALWAFEVDEQTAEEALALGLRAGLTTLEPTVRERLGLNESSEAESSEAGPDEAAPAAD